MSTLSVGTIKSLTAGTPPSVKDSTGTETGQFCRAWVLFNGTGTPTITDSFNVTSITDNGTGDYTINFTVAMANTNYAVSGSSDNGTSGAAMAPMIKNANPPTTTALRLQYANGNGTAIDSEYNSVVVFGD